MAAENERPRERLGDERRVGPSHRESAWIGVVASAFITAISERKTEQSLETARKWNLVEPVTEVDVDGIPLFVFREIVDDLAESFEREETELGFSSGVVNVGEATVDDDTKFVAITGLFDEEGADIHHWLLGGESEETRFRSEGAEGGRNKRRDGFGFIGRHMLFGFVTLLLFFFCHGLRGASGVTELVIIIFECETKSGNEGSGAPTIVADRSEQFGDVDASDEIFVDFVDP